MTQQTEQIQAVSTKLADAILAFCRARVGKTFFADDLRFHVQALYGKVAPASADRILRDLRARGKLDYTVLNRARSQYLVHQVVGA